MPTVSVYSMSGRKTGSMELSEAVFGIEPNQTVMHSAVINYLANQRQARKSAAAARSRGARRVRVTPVRALPALPSGRMAALRWAPSPAATASLCPRRYAVWLCSPLSPPRWPPARCWCSAS